MNFTKSAGFFVILSFFSILAFAQAVNEHPLIRPFPGSTLNEKMCKNMDYNEYSFHVLDTKTNKKTKVDVKGKYWKLLYTLYAPDGKWDRSHSVLEYKENYKSEALKHNGQVKYDKGNELVFTIPDEKGGTTWAHLFITNGCQQNLVIVEEAALDTKLEFGPAEMKSALDKDGYIELYDILFDSDKATLKVESSKQLMDVLQLLKGNPGLKLEIHGHTDDQGNDDYNMSLSKQRAEAIVSFLLLFGIDTTRLIPKGYGESKPIATNSTEEGRAKNRRVELKKIS